ncbi:MAG: AMP-binding protein [Acidobacteriota bacterium]|nr:MAG: AMP-binding protein [Acidobacteriota bacterium]
MNRADDLLFDEIVRQSRAAPDRVAFELVRDREIVALTRAGLAERVRRLGVALHDAGYGSGTKIALLMENRPAWAVVHLAAWYAGAVSVPLDPQLEVDKLARIVAHADSAVLVTSGRHRSKAHAVLEAMAGGPRLFDIDHDPELVWDGAAPLPATADTADQRQFTSLVALLAAHPAARENWSPHASPDGIDLLIYTSGTTGEPKGVMLSRHGIIANMRAVLERIRCSEEDRILGVLPLFHVLPLLANCIGPVFIGARGVFLEDLTPDSILRAFRDREISVFACVPLFFYRFHDRVQANIASLTPLKRRVARSLMSICRVARRRFGRNWGRKLLRVVHAPFGPRMRLFLTGGAKMNPEIYDELLDWGFTLTQGYGLTEATAALTATPVDELRAESVGRVLNGVELEIREADPGGVGEIWARSPSLMSGYYKDPAASAAVLVDGWLRTGDLGRLDSDGHLTITGRAKDVIVLASGKNVYPEELDEHYGQAELVAEICVIGREDPVRQDAERLHAVVVADLEAARQRGYVNVREMIRWQLENLGQQLPSWQRLTGVSFRSEPLPRTTTRKVRRFEVKRELLEQESRELAEWRESPTVESPNEASGTEAKILDIIARHAGRPVIHREDHLDLDLGLDSLDRVELMTELANVLGTRPADELIAHAHTVAEILDAAGEKAPTIAVAGERDESLRAERLVHDDAHWRRMLRDTPQEYGSYLKRGRLRESTVLLGARVMRAVFRLAFGLRINGVEHLPSSGSYLVCPNHASFLDAFVTVAALPSSVLTRVFFVGYSEYFDGVIGRWFSRWVRNIPVDQNRHMTRSLQAAAEGLRRGLVLVVFPEGGRSIDERVQAFRRGPAILARQIGVPLIPAGIWGAHAAWPREGRLRRHPIGIAFGAPIDPMLPAAGNDPTALSEALREQVIELVRRAGGLWSSPR